MSIGFNIAKADVAFRSSSTIYRMASLHIVCTFRGL
jgi:hypothetical protein